MNGIYKVVGILASLMAAATARKILDKAWQKTKGGEPPRNPASPETTWTEALTWAAVSGIAVGVAKTLSARGTAAAFHKTTGKIPATADEVGA